MKNTSRRWMRKRALCMLLVCAMLFSGTDLTALAVEPDTEMGTTTPGEGMDEAAPDEESETPDSTEETDEPDDSEQSTGEEQDPNAGTDEEDVTDKPDDVTGDEEENGGTGDADGDDQKDDADQADITNGEDESVSENSVSENNIISASKMASMQRSNMSVETSEGLGSLLMDGLQIAMQEEESAASQEYNISEIEVMGTTAYVTVHAVRECTAVVSVYEEGSNKPEAFGYASVQTGQSSISVEIETDSMPEFFEVKGYLVDSDSLRPLSKEYCSSMYTEAMQAFLKKTTDDFNDSQTVNLDEDKTTNFVVVNDEVALIREKEADGENSVNELVSYDETTNTYVFANVDENITNLQKNDIFVYQYDESEILTIKINDIRIENEEQTADTEYSESAMNAVITAAKNELCVEDVFQYVRIDEQLSTADAEEIDQSLCSEGVTYLGRGSVTGYAAREEESASKKPDVWSIDLKPKGKITAELGMEAKVKFYFDLHLIDKNKKSIWYVDIGFSCTVKIEGELKVEGRISVKLCKTALEIKNKLLTIKYVPEFVIGATFDGSLKTGFTTSAGIKLGNDVEDTGPYFTAECTAIELSAELNGYIGFDFNPQVKVAGILDAELKTGAHAGAEISAGTGISSSAYLENTRHECGIQCISGNFYIDIPLEGSLKVLKLKEVNLDEQHGISVDFLKISFGIFYYSLKHGQFGWGECPYQEYRTTVVVRTLATEKVKGAKVNNEATTDKNGVAKIWLPEGRQTIYALYNGETGTKRVDINGVMTVELTLGMYAGMGEHAVTQLCLSGEASSAVTLDHSLYVWGRNGKGLGNGATISHEPVKILDNVKTVSLGNKDSQNAAITENGSLYMWGYNNYGQLGDGTNDDRYTPINVNVSEQVRAVSLGQNHSAAITKDGSLYMWGSNGAGQLGIGTGKDVFNPMKVSELDKVQAVSLGNQHSAAITENGSLYIWGNNNCGQLGDSTIPNRSTLPVKILDDIKEVCLGSNYSAAITKNGALWMWGSNLYGEVGNGTEENQNTPVKVLDNVKTVSLKFDRSAAITGDGSLYMWGRNNYGQIGCGTYETQNKPAKILDHVKTVELGQYHTAAVTEDGSLYMWGANGSKQLGIMANAAQKNQPIKILDHVAAVNLGNAHSAAVTIDGSLYMWGNNTFGQLGDGTIYTTNIPHKIEFPTNDKTVNVYMSVSPEDSPIVMTDSEKSATRTVSFSGLRANDIYNVYAMKSRQEEDCLNPNNLLYIAQAAADADGNLSITCEMREDYENPEVFAQM